MKKERKYIKIFALTLFLMISISVSAEVKAETNYFDDNGVMYRLIFDDTQLKNFVQKDFALYYDQKDKQNEDIAKLTTTSNFEEYTLKLGFAKNKDLKIVIFETSESWQQSNEEKYIVSVIPDYIASNGEYYPTINEIVKLKKSTEYKYYFFAGSKYIWDGGFNINYLNFSKNINNVSFYQDMGMSELTGIQDLLIIVNKDGTIKRYNDLENTNNNLYKEIQNNAKYKLVYSSLDVYDSETMEIIRPKDEIRKEIRVEKETKVNPDESNEINFKIFNLKKDDKIEIIRKKENGEYAEQDIITKTITFDLGENQSYLVKDENIRENKIYDIKIYNSKSEIIYNEEYKHNMKSYILEDTTEEKQKLINLENYKINNKLANVIKNIFVIGNNEYLGKLIFLVFTITIITIIRKLV